MSSHLVSYPFQCVDPLPQCIAARLDCRSFTEHVDGPEERHAIGGPHIMFQACPCFPVNRKEENIPILHVPVDPALPASFLLANRWKECLQRLIKFLKVSSLSF